MKAAYGLTAAILCILLLLPILGCTPQAPSPTEALPTEDTTPTLSQGEIYDQARARLLSAPNQIITYTRSLTRMVGEQSYTEKATGTVSLSGLGTDALDAIVKESLTYGTLLADHTLTYCQGSAYSQISGCTFTQAMTAADFVSRQLPAALLDRSLYQTMQLQATGDSTSIAFSQALALENWVGSASDAQLTAASGTATLDSSGSLIASTYTAAYTQGETAFRLEVELRVSTPEALDLSALHPAHDENAVALACLEAPRLLMQAVGDIFTARDMQCTISETIYSEAIPLTRSRQTSGSISGSPQNITAALTNSIQITDFKGQPTTTTQSYQFAEGVCTSTSNGGEPKVLAGVTADTMRTSIEDTILSGLFATGYLAGAELTDSGEVYTLHFQGNDAYCTDLAQDIAIYLNTDLDGLASAYETTKAAGYLAIHKQTGLPTAMGISFARTHILGEVPNQLTYQLDQTLQLSAK